MSQAGEAPRRKTPDAAQTLDLADRSAGAHGRGRRL